MVQKTDPKKKFATCNREMKAVLEQKTKKKKRLAETTTNYDPDQPSSTV